MNRRVLVFSIVLSMVVPALNLHGIIFAEENATTSLGVRDLKSSIESKADELKKLNSEIVVVETDLNQTKSKNRGISQDISRLGANIRQLDLKVRAGEITVEKLRLELQELSINIADIEDGVQNKREAVAVSLRIVQRSDSENMLTILLKNGSLANSISEAQNLFDLNNGLSVEIAGLKSLQDELSEKISDTNSKKQEIEKETVNAKYRQTLTAEQRAERERLLKLTKAEQKKYEEKLDALTEKQKELAEEIEKLEVTLRAQIDPSALPAPRPGVLLFPVPEGRLTQGYGATSFALTYYKGKFHNGIDIGKSFGVEIVAAEDGIVLNVDDLDKYCPRVAAGKYIVIKHYNNLTTLYAHLSKQIVSVGDQVKRGEVIGYMGATGYATGPHLHFTVYASNTYTLRQTRFCGLLPTGGDLSPLLYLEKNG